MSILKKAVKVSKKQQGGPLYELQDEISVVSTQVDEFQHHVLENSISSPERSRNYKRCERLQSQIESLLANVNDLNKDNEPNPPKDYESQKMVEQKKLLDMKSIVQKISKQLEPDEIEEDYFREVKKSGADIDSRRNSKRVVRDCDEDEDDDDEDEEDDYDEADPMHDQDNDSEDDEEETDDDNTIVVKYVEALSDFPGEQHNDLPFKRGEILTVLETREDGWWIAENSAGRKGIVPKTLIKIVDIPESPLPPISKKEQHDESKEEEDQATDLPSPKRSGKELWKSLQKGSKQETSVTDVLKALGAMPSGFRPTTLGKMAKDERFHASSWVVPKLRPSHLSFKDLVWDPVNKQLTPRPVKINRVFSIVSARKIPLPGTGIEVLSRQVRMCLWDWKRKQVLSNVHIVRAVQHEKDAMAWNFSARSESSMYDSECVARLESTEDTVGILFELGVLYLRSSTGEKSEVSCGWCLLKLFEETGAPAANKNYEIVVNGGTPFDENHIDLDGSISVRDTPNKLQSLVRENQQARITVKLISFNKSTKEIHDTLPENLLTCHQYAQFIGQYRQLIAEVVFRDERERYSTDFIADPVISTFPLAIRFTDLMDSLKRRWDIRNKKELKRSMRRISSVMKNFFREVYMDSVYPLLNSAYLPPFIWGDSNRELERLRIILDHESRPTLENLFSTERLHKPFNIDRITFNVVSKHSIT